MTQAQQIDHSTLADQMAALHGSMDGITAQGKAFLYGAETALRVTAEAADGPGVVDGRDHDA